MFAAPFQIHRSIDNPSGVRSATVLATTAYAPFDDETGVLGDGNNYFYVVDHPAGLPLQLSVHKNPGQNTVRLGFKAERQNRNLLLREPLGSQSETTT